MKPAFCLLIILISCHSPASDIAIRKSLEDSIADYNKRIISLNSKMVRDWENNKINLDEYRRQFSIVQQLAEKMHRFKAELDSLNQSSRIP